MNRLVGENAAYIISQVGTPGTNERSCRILRPDVYEAVDTSKFDAVWEQYPTMILELLFSKSFETMDSTYRLAINKN